MGGLVMLTVGDLMRETKGVSEGTVCLTVCGSVQGVDKLTVCEMLESEIPVIAADRSLDECMTLMLEKSATVLPVMADGKLAGTVSLSDVVRSALQEKEFTIAQLVNYITGSRSNDEPEFAYA